MISAAGRQELHLSETIENTRQTPLETAEQKSIAAPPAISLSSSILPLEATPYQGHPPFPIRIDIPITHRYITMATGRVDQDTNARESEKIDPQHLPANSHESNAIVQLLPPSRVDSRENTTNTQPVQSDSADNTRRTKILPFQPPDINNADNLLKEIKRIFDQTNADSLSADSSSPQISLKIPGTISMIGGLSGAVNLFGMAGTSPTVFEEVMLWGSIIGTTILHAGSTFEKIIEVRKDWPDFKATPPSQKAAVILKQVVAHIIPLLGSLPDGALAFLGIYYRTEYIWLASIAALLNITFETNTFKGLAIKMLVSLKESKYQAINGITKRNIQSLTQVLTGTHNQQGRTGRIPNHTAKVYELLSHDRRMRKEVTKFILQRNREHLPLTPESIENFFKKSHLLDKLKGYGSGSLYTLSSIFIFILTAEFFAARGLVSSVSSEMGNLNTTLSNNLTLSNNSSFLDFNCTSYLQTVSVFENALYNTVGYCGSISSVFLGGSLVYSIERVFKNIENLFIAFYENEFIEEVQRIFCRNWTGKLSALTISAFLAFCYRTMASANTEYLEQLHNLQDCDIDGFGSYLPSLPHAGPIVVNAAFFTSFTLYFLPLMMIFDLITCTREETDVEVHTPDRGECNAHNPHFLENNEIELGLLDTHQQQD